mgnify:CR=1 FL=1
MFDEKKLRVENLYKSYNGRKVVNNATLELKKGQIVGLLGPNGAGKTTLFYMTVGLIYPDSGNIYLNGKNIREFPLHKRSRLGIAYLPQESSLFRKLSVYDNIALAFEAQKFSKSVVKEKTKFMLRKFGLDKISTSLGAALSGGERRRCEIARCLAIGPDFVLFDEPFAGIDPIAVSEIQSYIKELREEGIGVLITDHNVRETLTVCDYGYLMRDGRIFLAGSPKEITENEEAKKFYLGERFQL